ESWDMESSDEEKKKPITPAPPPKKKKSVAQVIAEREELKRKAAEQIVRIVIYRLKIDLFKFNINLIVSSVIDADLENAEGMFQGLTIRETEDAPSKKITPKTKDPKIMDPMTKDPKTKEEFEEFTKVLVDQIRKHEKQGLYVNFINDFIRELCAPLRDVDVRKFASKLKPALQTEKFDLYDTTDYGNYDDFDDFM
ncbi:6469_t:CDS:2, partial [Funneliformis geosporum]